MAGLKPNIHRNLIKPSSTISIRRSEKHGLDPFSKQHKPKLHFSGFTIPVHFLIVARSYCAFRFNAANSPWTGTGAFFGYKLAWYPDNCLDSYFNEDNPK
jgi:hypothetical protein